MVAIESPKFKQNAKRALNDPQLQRAMAHVRSNFIAKRAAAANALPEFEALRDGARDIKNHVLEHLDLYLEKFEQKVLADGGKVHWAATPIEARGQILDIFRRANVKTVTKGKSMVSEEIGLNEFLESADIEPIETDLGEYIIQLRKEHPSHIIAPAVHLNMDQVREDFLRAHKELPIDRSLDEPESLLKEARAILRERFVNADAGITGANFMIAETGQTVIVTNEGNGDLTQTLPRIHIVLATIEKIVPTLEDFSTIMRVLARSATGQEMSVYTTLSSGPRRENDPDGPEEFHVVILDNGRSKMLGTKFHEMLRCIRCGACLNHCPVFQAIGGHAYGWVYPGPMGSVLSPQLIGLENARHLPNASTFCGRCEEVCPMRIPLPKMLRSWRQSEHEEKHSPLRHRVNLKLWALLAKRPRLYHFLLVPVLRVLAWMGGKKNHLSFLPLAGGWTKHRDLPAPEGSSFLAQWARRQNSPVKEAKN